MTTNSSILKLDELIMVEPPYNILQNLKLNEDGSVEAIVVNEYQHQDEGGPIGGAEFGRHIAILGSIALACAYRHKHRHYYLAVHALIERKHSKVYQTDVLKLKTRPVLLEKRKGKIYGELTDQNNELINSATVEYLILDQNVFSRVYERHQKDTLVKNEISPYIHRRNLSNIVIDGHTARGEYGTVLEHECEGHFRHFPALPVALIGGLFGELGFNLFKHNIPGFDKVVSPRTDIRAHGLVFSGEHLHFTGKISKWISDDTIQITAEARVGDEIVSDVEFELKGVNTSVNI